MIKLHLDLDKQFSDNPMIFIRVADGNADGVQAKITRDSAPVDLTGYSLAFEGITSAGKTVIDNTATGTADGSQLLNPGNLPATKVTDLEQAVTDLQTSSKVGAKTDKDLATGLEQVQQSVTSIAIGLATKGDE